MDITLAKRFAWLLRKDLREAFKDFDSPAFQEWWLVKGRQEYPAWAHAVPADELQALFASAGPATVAGVKVEVPQVVHTLARLRPDAVKELSTRGKLDNEKFFAWAIVRGLAEHHLAAYAPRHVVAMLDQPVPATQPEPVTLLMYLLWQLMDEATQQARDIHTAQGRAAYLPWFFSVVSTLGLAPLVAGRWKAWVKTQPQFKDAQKNWASLPGPTPLAATPPAEKPFGLNIYGFAYGELGIGEDLRMAVECCEAASIPYHVVNIDAGDTRQADMHLKGKVGDGTTPPPFNTNLFCLPAFDTASRVFMQKGAAVFEGYRNIGWWPWELAVFPKAWKPYAFELVDEVWASSQFLYDMYKQATDKPVKLVPLAVSVARMKPYRRKHYGLAEKKFFFLYIFDFNSSVARKNPMAAVQAFKQAFEPDDDSVALVLKTMNIRPNNPQWQAFLKECQTDKRIQLITETLNRPEVLGLINACDAYVSLHRAEGFGRTLAEAMLLGKPVIATNYSGNIDFMHPQLNAFVSYKLTAISEQDYQWIDSNDLQFWADADVSSAADCMIQIVKKTKDRNNALQLKYFAGKKFAPDELSRSVQDALSTDT